MYKSFKIHFLNYFFKGRVCVPIDIEKIDQFDPFTVPSISDLCEQLERCDLINMDKKIKGKISKTNFF